MSTAEQRRAGETAKSKETLLWACAVCREFIADWDRVSSIIGWMEDAVNAAVAKDGDDESSSWIPKTLTANTYWLREQLEISASNARKSLEDAGVPCGPLL